jgi:hypothetical protein
MSEEHSSNKVVVEIHMCSSEVYMKRDTHIFPSDTAYLFPMERMFAITGTPVHSSGVSELNAQFACTVVLWLKN